MQTSLNVLEKFGFSGHDDMPQNTNGMSACHNVWRVKVCHLLPNVCRHALQFFYFEKKLAKMSLMGMISCQLECLETEFFCPILS